MSISRLAVTALATLAAGGVSAQTLGTYFNNGFGNQSTAEEETEAKKPESESEAKEESTTDENQGGFWNENLYAKTEAEAAAAAEAEAEAKAAKAKAEDEAAKVAAELSENEDQSWYVEEPGTQDEFNDQNKLINN
ncbi:MAG: hypothetical protein AAGC81_16795 [Pseudomonadota bacterium]